jgi:uncharacterized protein (TIGR04255 family)
MRDFPTPLFEVSTEIAFAYEPVVDFPGKAFYNHFAERLPLVQQFPLLIVPAEQATPEQMRATPAIYRFSSATDKRSIFIGPRMVAANVRGWSGYPEYREFVQEVVDVYFSIRRDATVERHSVGFYNRIPVTTVEEVREIMAVPLNIRDGASLLELVAQCARNTEMGSLLSQVFTSPPDGLSDGTFLSVNNIIRAIVPKERSSLNDIIQWLDNSHQIARDEIWSMLSESAKEAWKATSAKDS